MTLLSGLRLEKSFGTAVALAEVDVSLHEGEVVAVMGPSGSGKSTLLHVLSGIITPDSGAVVFEGRDLSVMATDERVRLRRTAFGMVFQQGHLVPELSALENVMLPLLLERVDRQDARRTALSWMERFGIDHLSSRRPGEMSGGQMQRAAMSRALVSRPRIVFADEPTGALDTLTGEKVMRALTDCAIAENVAIILVTHDPRTASHADREITLRDGGVVTPTAFQ